MGDVFSKHQVDFQQAMGESFGDAIVPPVDFEDASPHECCEVLWAAIGKQITPNQLSKLTATEVEAWGRKFGDYFGCDPPSTAQIREAIANTLARWPVGSLDE